MTEPSDWGSGNHDEQTNAGPSTAVWRAERARDRAEAALAQAREQLDRMQPLLNRMRNQLAAVQSSKFWKLRNAWFRLKKIVAPGSSNPLPYWLPELGDAAGDESAGRVQLSPYEGWLASHRFRPADRARLLDVVSVLPLRPRFSILMPVYETPERYLREAIESVLGQVYPDWELCIADDASKKPHVREILEEYAEADSRIKLVFRETNGHISAASNSALAIANGEFIALLDHDDQIAPDALFENALMVNRRPDVDVIYSDEDKIHDNGQRDGAYFKPDWAPESLLARNYVCHLGVYRRELVQSVGGFRTGFEGSQDYDLLLRVTEKTDRVAHIPRVLYHWRVHSGSTSTTRDQKRYAFDAARRALEEALERRGEPGRVEHDDVRGGLYTVRYELRRPGKISIIIPTRDHGDDVDLCLRSLFERSSYQDVEVILIDNGSRDRPSLEQFERWSEREPARLKVIPYDVPFNFSRINNYGVSKSSGDYLLFLNNDTEVITADWLEAMLEQAQRQPIGAVGAKLLYPDNTIQHAGVIVGLGGVAGHSHKYFPADAPGYFYTLQTINNFSAVTAACLMVRRAVFDEVGGFDESLAIAFNDVDFCLRLRRTGYRNVYLPHVVLYHHESKSRGLENTEEKRARFFFEQQVMRERWKTHIVPDPYYNVNLTRDRENYEIGT